MKKEFREIFRDRRTVMSVVISPLLITPAMFALMGSLIGGQVEKIKTQVYHVRVLNEAVAPEIVRALKLQPNLKFMPDTGPEADVEKQIKDRKLDAALILPADAVQKMKVGVSVPITLLEDAGNQTSQAAAGRLSSALGMIGEQIVALRLQAAQLPAGAAHPFAIAEKPISTGGNGGTIFLTMMLPYILTLSAVTGAIYASLDQVAGEKERGTLETLLVSPASRRDIVLGKFGAVVMVCLISSILSITGLGLAFSLHTKGLDLMAKGGLHLGAPAVGVCMLVMLPLSVLFAGLLLAVSTFARNQKEAQTYLGPILMVVFVPMMASIFLGTDVSLGMAVVPIMGASIIIKQALSGTYDLAFILTAFAASTLYAGIALAVATKLFQSESVLIKA